jgi:NADPH2:quinone reductase
VKKGQWVLVHAAAGGVGSLLTQWARNIGAHVIGTVGSDEKAARARANGCDHVIVYTREDVVEGVKQATKGDMVDVAYDSVGKATVKASLESLHDHGHLVRMGPEVAQGSDARAVINSTCLLCVCASGGQEVLSSD